MYEISFNGIRTGKKGVAVTTRPQIPTPKQRAEYVEVAGMDGTLRVSDGTFEDIVIPVQMNFVRSVKYWHETARDVRNWLFGSGILKLGNLNGWHYRVKAITLSDIENINKMGGQFTAEFLCEPFQYQDGGNEFLPLAQVLINPFFRCQPVYLIEGSGNATLTVNGNEWTANVTGGSIYIDTEKKLVYNANKQNRRTATSGEFKDLILENGVNTISISSGFSLKVKPNWRSI